MNHEVARKRWKGDASDGPDHKAALAEQDSCPRRVRQRRQRAGITRPSFHLMIHAS